ncbi:MAG TPA: hypothetical protein PLM59_06545 [Oscillospiraceae bacterium]|jgi:hypothetical protein|nr:hypothetical protein [Oscillospiraceae bacterium]
MNIYVNEIYRVNGPQRIDSKNNRKGKFAEVLKKASKKNVQGDFKDEISLKNPDAGLGKA